MANTIRYAKRYSGLLNEVYAAEAKSTVLDAPANVVRQGANAHEIIIPRISMDGLADYSRSGGYVDGDVNLSWDTVAFNYERGRMFTVDNMDNEETQEIAFGRLAGEFMRTRSVPELDAFRFACLASGTGDSGTGTLSTGADVIQAIRAGTESMDEAEVGEDGRYLFITPTLMGYIEDMDSYKSKAVLSRFSQIIRVPQSRFYTEIDLLDGTTAGEEDGGYAKADGAEDINFLIVHKPAIICFSKHVVNKVITPEENQTADAWKYGYRSYGLTDILPGKSAGVYVHTT